MTRNYQLGLHGRLLGGGLNGVGFAKNRATKGLATAADTRFQNLDVPTFLRRKLSIPGLRRRVA